MATMQALQSFVQGLLLDLQQALANLLHFLATGVSYDVSFGSRLAIHAELPFWLVLLMALGYVLAIILFVRAIFFSGTEEEPEEN